MQRYGLLAANLVLLICSVAFDPSIEVKSAAQLPDAQRREQMRKLLPRVQSILPQSQAFGQAGLSFVDTVGGCPSKLPSAILSMAQKAKQPIP